MSNSQTMNLHIAMVDKVTPNGSVDIGQRSYNKYTVNFQNDPTDWECLAVGDCKFIPGQEAAYQIDSSVANGDAYNKIKVQGLDWVKTQLEGGGTTPSSPRRAYAGNNSGGDARSKSIELQASQKLGIQAAMLAPMVDGQIDLNVMKQMTKKFYEMLQELKNEV